jgi:hypothetical protein
MRRNEGSVSGYIEYAPYLPAPLAPVSSNYAGNIDGVKGTGPATVWIYHSPAPIEIDCTARARRTLETCGPIVNPRVN